MPAAASRSRIPDTAFAVVIRAFLNSPQFRDYAHNTQETWGRELRRAERPELLGGWSIYEIRPAVVQMYLDGISHKPGKATVALAALRRVEAWAIVRDLLVHPITLGVKAAEPEDTGHEPWTDAQVDLVEREANPFLARIVILGANTGQRGSDICRMGWGDVETIDGRLGINVRQQKTGVRLWIPVTQALSRALDSWERTAGPICRKRDGSPWSRKQLSAAWSYERDHNPQLAEIKTAGLHLHGLRATAVVRLRRAGATELQITDMVGMSEQMVRRYCRMASQRENAVAAVIHLERRENDGKLIRREGGAK